MTPSMQFRASQMLLWAALPGIGVWAAGSVAAWILHAHDQCRWAAIALAVSLGVEGLTAVVLSWIVNRAIARQTRNLAFVVSQADIMASMAKILTLVLVGVLVWYGFALPAQPFFLWLVGVYAAMLVGEKVWLLKTIRPNLPKAKG